MGISTYLADELLDHVFGNGAYSAPGTVYIGLYTAAPNDGGGGTECTGNNYARVATTGTTWDAASSRSITNGTVIQFPTPSGSWGGTATHFGAFDASSSGNLLWWGALTTPQAIGTGNDVEFAAGDLEAEFSASA